MNCAHLCSRRYSLTGSILESLFAGDVVAPSVQASTYLLNLLFSQSGPAHIEAFLSVLKAVTKEETVQYVLAVILQLLQGALLYLSCFTPKSSANPCFGCYAHISESPARAKLFHQQSDQHPGTLPEPFTVLLR